MFPKCRKLGTTLNLIRNTQSISLPIPGNIKMKKPIKIEITMVLSVLGVRGRIYAFTQTKPGEWKQKLKILWHLGSHLVLPWWWHDSL